MGEEDKKIVGVALYKEDWDTLLGFMSLVDEEFGLSEELAEIVEKLEKKIEKRLKITDEEMNRKIRDLEMEIMDRWII